ncbi:MAG: hypothetical protein KC731_28365, partial [Myxococcales bacterium]|nr:hypothetical protein [Myxococcales bacterium]
AAEDLQIESLDYAEIHGSATSLWDPVLNENPARRHWLDSLEAERPWPQDSEPDLQTSAGRGRVREGIRRIILGRGGIGTNDWSQTAGEFSPGFRHDVAVALHARASGQDQAIIASIRTQHVDWDSYAPGEGNAKKPSMKLGTYTEALNSQSNMDRQSHHTTQFLLAEYFVDDGPFLAGIDYPGLHRSSGTPSHVGTGTQRLRLLDLRGSSGRGTGMPAVSLYKDTHNRSIHIASRSTWSEQAETEGSLSTNQRNTVQGWFESALDNDYLGAMQRVNDGASSVDWPNGAAAMLRPAVLETYHAMRRHMLDAGSTGYLQRSIEDNEIPRYEEWVQEAGLDGYPAYRVPTGAAAAAVSTIRDFNDRQMLRFGFR